MSLESLDFRSTLTTSSADLIDDFFAPALKNSVRYDRAVGYFTSGWIRKAADGILGFAANSGWARWITSPNLTHEDWETLLKGSAARQDDVIKESLQRSILELKEYLHSDTLSALAWLLADGILDFKLALPRDKLEMGEFHDKFGVFTDEHGNQVSFNGSYNDSIQANLNYESIKIFVSWNDSLSEFVSGDAERFEKLWNNFDPNVRVFDLPESAREQIVRLRNNERPYPEPDWHKIADLKALGDSAQRLLSVTPHVPPSITLRDYQVEAIDAWFRSDCWGLFEMATGTGKTITALAAAARLLSRERRLILVISVPYKHLVEQWSAEAAVFGFRTIQVVEARKKWEQQLAREIQNYGRKRSQIITIVTTNAAFHRGQLSQMLADYWREALFVADEAHNVGSPKLLASLPQLAPWRLGLSATPIRHYDQDGTDAILDYFGDIVFQFGLDKAIGTYLTPYFYYPIPIEIMDDEFEEFTRLTRQLQRYHPDPEIPMPEQAQKIAINRARILNNSRSKLHWIRENIKEYSEIAHTLFYVGDQQFDAMKQTLGFEKRIRIHEFTQRQDNRERAEILNRFANGDLQALVAMKCLDEGIDIPPTRTAYFLASSGNPREFIQRRGRVLRRAEGKTHATLYDLISIPPMDFIELGDQSPDYSAVRAAVRREYRRVKEFSGLAENQYQALDPMFKIADKLKLLDV